MSNLLVIAFPNEEKAKQGRKQLLSMEKQDLIMMEDAVVVVKKADGAITLNQLLQPSAFWEIRAAASGYPAPPGAGALTDFGTSDKFVRDIAEAIPRGGAAAFVLVAKITSDKVLETLRAVGGKVLHTSFDKSAVEAIRAAVAASA